MPAPSLTDSDPLGIEIRAGVHTGECETLGDKVVGVAVHIGARVAALAGPSEILVSSTVKDLAVGSGISFEDAGERELIGIPDLWRLYRVVSPVMSGPAPARRSVSDLVDVVPHAV